MKNEPIDEHADETFRALQAELALTPSPEFAAKVRAGVAADPAPSWFGWRVATLAGVTATSIAVSVLVWERGRVPPDAAPRPQVASAQAAVTPSPDRVHDVVMPVTPGAATRRAPSLDMRPTPKALEVLVPSDQAIALRHLMDHVRSGVRFDLPSNAAQFDEVTGELVPAPAITIPPLSVEPLPGPAEGRGGGRENQ